MSTSIVGTETHKNLREKPSYLHQKSSTSAEFLWFNPIPDILPPSSDLDVVNARSCCTRASADLEANANLWRADIYIKKVGGIIIKFMSVCIMYIMNFVYHTSFIKFLYWTYCECIEYVDCSIALMHHVSWKGEWKLDQVDDLQSSTLDALKPRIHVTFAESLYSETTQRLVKWHICNFFFATGESTFETWKQTVLFASAQKSINPSSREVVKELHP